jgi:hypothetical protein
MLQEHLIKVFSVSFSSSHSALPDLCSWNGDVKFKSQQRSWFVNMCRFWWFSKAFVGIKSKSHHFVTSDISLFHWAVINTGLIAFYFSSFKQWNRDCCHLIIMKRYCLKLSGCLLSVRLIRLIQWGCSYHQAYDSDHSPPSSAEMGLNIEWRFTWTPLDTLIVSGSHVGRTLSLPSSLRR